MTTSSSLFRAAVLLLLLQLTCSHFLFAGDDKDLRKHYGLIFGTAYGPGDLTVYGAKVEIHPAGKNRPKWELFSDRQGEFALRVPPGPADYVVTGEFEIVNAEKTSEHPNKSKKKKLRAEAKVHINGEERQDISLHFIE
ncbi:MAG TPA: hypothetical protein VKZ53_20250 [Candidatus Angelobacter sp.]|nr:hypothetical protein [Candidatus Angelobacter sp.]